MRVVTYATPLPGVEVDLCAECAETQREWALGPAQHGLHEGRCEGRRHQPVPPIAYVTQPPSRP